MTKRSLNIAAAIIFSLMFLASGCRSAGIDWSKKRSNELTQRYLISTSSYDIQGNPIKQYYIYETSYYDRNRDSIYESSEKRCYVVDTNYEIKLESAETKNVSFTKQQLLDNGASEEHIGIGPY